jgi:hypothetical protein
MLTRYQRQPDGGASPLPTVLRRRARSGPPISGIETSYHEESEGGLPFAGNVMPLSGRGGARATLDRK